MDKWLVSYATATVIFGVVIFGAVFLASAAIKDPVLVGVIAVISVIAVVIRANFDRIFKDW